MSAMDSHEKSAAPWWNLPSVQFALVGAVAAGIVFWQLGSTVLDDHEAKAALAADGILRADQWLLPGPSEAPLPARTTLNRWLVPVNNGRPRLVKTPLPYWCIAAVATFTGRVDEWTARLPAAVSAVLCAWVTLALGRRLLGARAGLLGALMFAVSVGFQKWGRNARPEMMLCLWMTASMACFHLGLSASTRARRAVWMLGFWVCMGLANLAKEFFPLLLALPLAAYVFWRAEDRRWGGAVSRAGLAIYCLATAAAMAASILVASVPALHWWRRVGLSRTVGGIATTAVLLAAPLVWYALRTRPWGQILRLLPTALPGAAVMLAAFLPWMWYMQRLFGQAGEVFNEQVAQRAAGSGGWAVAAPHYYLLPLITLTLPWVGFLPGGAACAWLRRFAARREGLTYLFLWWAGLAALLTVAAGKREHYLLPALPGLCLLMGFVAEDVFFRNRWISPALARALAIAYGAVGLAAPVVMAGLWVSAARSAEWMERLRPAAREPARWSGMLVVTALAAIPMACVLVGALRRRLRAAPGLILGAMVIVYVGYHAQERAWDARRPAADFARRAAGMIRWAEPVASWGDPQAKTVFYFGRNIPVAQWQLQRLRRRLSEEAARARWEQWLKDPRNVAWMFCYGRYVDKIAPLGFEVALQVQGRQKKRLLFTLMRNTNPPPPPGRAREKADG